MGLCIVKRALRHRKHFRTAGLAARAPCPETPGVAPGGLSRGQKRPDDPAARRQSRIAPPNFKHIVEAFMIERRFLASARTRRSRRLKKVIASGGARPFRRCPERRARAFACIIGKLKSVRCHSEGTRRSFFNVGYRARMYALRPRGPGRKKKSRVPETVFCASRIGPLLTF